MKILNKIGVLMLMLMVLTTGFTYAADFAYIRSTLLNQDPDPAEPGKYVELRFKIEKQGNEELKGIMFRLDAEYPFSFDESDTAEKTLGDWSGYSGDNEYYTLYYKMKVADGAIKDTYKLNLMTKYNKVGGWTKLGEYEIRVGDTEVPDLALGSIVSSPRKLVNDIEEGELQVDLDNLGDKDAENVKVTLELPEGFEATYSYSDVDTLGTVEAGSSKTATFFIDVDEYVLSGSYSANLHIRYKEADDDDNEVKELDIPFDLNIKNKPSFEVIDVKTVPDPVHAGDIVEMYVVINNTGGKKGESVSLRAFKDSTQPLDFEEKTGFVGTLEPGETGETVLKIEVKEDAAPQSYQLDMEIRSIDGEEVIVQDKKLTLDVVNGIDKKNSSSPLVGIMIVGIIVAGGLGFFFGLKKRK